MAWNGRRNPALDSRTFPSLGQSRFKGIAQSAQRKILKRSGGFGGSFFFPEPPAYKRRASPESLHIEFLTPGLRMDLCGNGSRQI